MFYKIVHKVKRLFWNCLYKHFKFAAKGDNVVFDRGISILNAEKIYLGNNIFIGADSVLQCIVSYNCCQYEPKLLLDNSVTMTRRCTIYCAQSVTIGENTLIGSDVLITDENHGTNPELCFREQDLIVKSVSIGKNVWIGDKVCILPGVSIGDNSIIGSGAVVTKSVPNDCICVGNPAKVIKRYNREKNAWEYKDEVMENGF